MGGSRWGRVAIEFTTVLVVGIFLWHGIPKAFDVTTAMEKFAGWGLPGWLGPATGWAEVIAAPLLYLPAARRGAIAVLTVVIIGAIVTVQLPAGITPGLERDLLILAALLLLLSRGTGPSRPEDA